MTSELMPPPIYGRKHPASGIISAALGLISFVFLLLMFFLFRKYSDNAGMIILCLGCVIIAPFIAGIVLSIIGLTKKNAKKTFSVLGLSLSCVDLILTIILYAALLSPHSRTEIQNPPILTPTAFIKPTQKPSPTPFTIQSPSLGEIIRQPPALGTVHVFGRVRWGEWNIPSITTDPLSLWMRNELTGKSVKYPIEYDSHTGEFIVANLPYGEYGIGTDIIFSSDFPQPGDYSGFKRYKIEQTDKRSLVGIDLQLLKVMHLTSPVNNAGILPDELITYDKGDLTFNWDYVHNASRYEICLDDVEPYVGYSPIECKHISETTYKFPQLEPLAGDHLYQVRLYAEDENGTRIGNLMNRYSNSYGWGYSFKIK